jgi:hypothetical protein
MDAPLDALVGFYRGRASAENLIKEANNDAGLAAHPSKRWVMNANWFQIVMLAYNLNCWLLLFQREKTARVADMPHITLATARLRFLFLAAKIWRHAGRVGVSYSDHYQERGILDRLMQRLRDHPRGRRVHARDRHRATVLIGHAENPMRGQPKRANDLQERRRFQADQPGRRQAIRGSTWRISRAHRHAFVHSSGAMKRGSRGLPVKLQLLAGEAASA